MIVFLGDVAKGALATSAGRAAGGPRLGLAAGLAAVLGHVFPAFRRFRGGRGVATAAGTVLVLEPRLAVPFVGAWVGVARLTGKASLASVLAISGVPMATAALRRPRWEVAGFSALAALVLVRHGDNLVRLLRGEELPLRAEQ
jgi:glycerol-3-phosphate acyltransferase PlsY